MRTGTALRCPAYTLGLTALAVVSLDRPLCAQGDPLGPRFDSYVKAVMAHWGAPGLAVVVVRDGKVALSKGYGTRVLGGDRPVDQDTRLQIASNSKAVTATALAMLVDEGKLAWDDPVKRYIPELALTDSVAANRMTVRDLVLHRTGLPLSALGGFDNAAYGLKELLTALRSTQLDVGFRERQAYSNVGFALLGEVVARASGMPWERFVRERVFAPLGMRDSYTSNADLIKRFGTPSPDHNILVPAVKAKGKIVPGDWKDVGTHRLYAPAGGITTTASDLAKWMLFQLGGGEYNGTRLLSKTALESTRTPAVLLDPLLAGMTTPVSRLVAGSAGWIVVPYGEHLIYEAPGGWMSSLVAIVPDAQVGVAVATNAYFFERAPFESLHLVAAIVMRALDACLGLPEREWSTLFEEALVQSSR